MRNTGEHIGRAKNEEHFFRYIERLDYTHDL